MTQDHGLGVRVDFSKIPRMNTLLLLAGLGVFLIAIGTVLRGDRPAGASSAQRQPLVNVAGAGSTSTGYSSSLGDAPVESAPALAGTGRSQEMSAADRYRADLETRAEGILSRIEGAGTVAVEITLDGSARRDYVFNTIEEERVTEDRSSPASSTSSASSSSSAAASVSGAGSGSGSGYGVRSAEVRRSRELVLAADPSTGRGQSPVLVMEGAPRIAGVLVAASGACDSKVRLELARAAQTLLGVPAHRLFVVCSTR